MLGGPRVRGGGGGVGLGWGEGKGGDDGVGDWMGGRCGMGQQWSVASAEASGRQVPSTDCEKATSTLLFSTKLDNKQASI